MPFTCNISKWTEANMPPSYDPATYCTPSPYYSKDVKDLLAGFRDSIDPMIQAQMGLCGTPVYLSGTGTSTAKYCMIQILSDTVLNVVAGQTTEQTGAAVVMDLTPLSAVILPKGLILNGNFTKITLVSGLVKCYPHPFL
jgi:hypothetical protein